MAEGLKVRIRIGLRTDGPADFEVQEGHWYFIGARGNECDGMMRLENGVLVFYIKGSLTGAPPELLAAESLQQPWQP